MKIGFLYGGQGSQKVGMGKDLYEKYPTFKKIFDMLPKNFVNLAFEGSIEELSKTVNTQPLLVAYSIGVTEILKEKGIVPDMVAGLSLGEYSALYASGVLGVQETLDLITYRAMLMDKASENIDTKMAAVLNLSRETLTDIVKKASEFGVVKILNYNCPNQIVIAGEVKAVDCACEFAMQSGAKRCMPLKVSGPFHTSFMKSAGDLLSKRFKTVTFNEMKVPVIFNAVGREKSLSESIPYLLEKQVQSAVYFEDSIRYMLDIGVDTFVEISPINVLSNFVKKINPDVKFLDVAL